MIAVQFQATVKDGVIEIPAEYRQELKDRVHVIVLSEETIRAHGNLIDQLLDSPIRVSGFHPLTRDEAHAR